MTDYRTILFPVPGPGGPTEAGKVLTAMGDDTAEWASVPNVGDLDVYDNFSRTVAPGGWGTANTGQAWSVLVGSAADFSVAGGAGVVATTADNQGHAASVDAGSADQDIYVDFTWASTVAGGSVDFYLEGRSDLVGTDYQLLVSLMPGGTYVVYLYKNVATVPTVLAASFASGTFTPGGFIRTRLQIRDTTISAKVWPATAAEPSTWQASVTDSSVVSGTNWKFYFFRNGGNTSTTPTASFDNFHVYVPTDAVVNIAPNAVENRHLYLSWRTYAPVLRQGSTVITGDPRRTRYIQIGKLVICQGFLTALGAGTAGTPVYISLPFPVSATYVSQYTQNVGTFGLDVGGAGGPMYSGLGVLDTVDDGDGVPVGVLAGQPNASGQYIGQAGSGFAGAVASGDIVSWSIQYEVD